MPLYRSTLWKRRHSSKKTPIIHNANIPRLSLLLESSHPTANPDPSLIVEKSAPAASNEDRKHTPAWSPITPRARTSASWPGTSTSIKAPSWSPIMPQAPPLALSPLANLAPIRPSIKSLPAATPTLSNLAIVRGTATDRKAALQQLLVNLYAEAAMKLISLADQEQQIPGHLPFEMLNVRPALAESCQLPGLRAAGLDMLYEVGQMDFFTWRVKLHGPQYGRAKVMEDLGSVSIVEDALADGGGRW